MNRDDDPADKMFRKEPQYQAGDYNNATCGHCRWFDFNEPSDKPFGKCRRRAPQDNVAGEAYIGAIWPLVIEDDWCGEWQPQFSHLGLTE